MTADAWDKEEIKKLVRSSGRPLEVECAQAFIGARMPDWNVELGSHFSDASRERELDVLAVKHQWLDNHLLCRLRVLVECKGFPPTRRPLAYSVSHGSVPTVPQRFICEHRQPPVFRGGSGELESLAEESTRSLLERLNLSLTRSLVAFDLAERIDVDNQGRQLPAAKYNRATDHRGRRGDGEIFAGIDSALRASIHWAEHDRQTTEAPYYATLFVPVCVFSVPFWEVGIDRGDVGEPAEATRGYQVVSLPRLDGARWTRKSLAVLVIAKTELAELVRLLDNAFEEFRDAISNLMGDWPGSWQRKH